MKNIIVAATLDRAIGLNGDQLYYIPADLKHFKQLTSGHTVIMGRKTFEALPNGALPNRTNIVITRDKAYNARGAVIAHSIEDAFAMTDGEVYVIGGAQIYDSAMPHADRLYLTEIDMVRPDSDTYFPEINKAEWTLIDAGETLHDERNNLDFRFLIYEHNRTKSE